MIMLLGTYTTENASQAREEAQRCIVASLADPQTFLLDHLLQLKPVKFLEGELIHDLLKVSWKLFPIFEFTMKSFADLCVREARRLPAVLRQPPRFRRRSGAQARGQHDQDEAADVHAASGKQVDRHLRGHPAAPSGTESFFPDFIMNALLK